MHVRLESALWSFVVSVLVVVATAPLAEKASAQDLQLGDLGDTTGLTGTSVEDLQTRLQAAGQMMQQGQFEEALQASSEVYSLADRQRRTQATQLATAEFAQYGELMLLALTGRGQALAELQEYTAALEQFAQVLELSPDYPPTLLARGEVYLELNLAYDASLDFEKALKAVRGNPRAMFGLGKSYVLIGRADEAIRLLTRVLEQEDDPNRAEAFRFRGMAYGALYQFDKAIADLRRSIEIDPAPHETYFELGQVDLLSEDYAAAIDELARAIDHYVPPKGRENDANAQIYILGHLRKAMAHIELGKKATDEATRQAAYQAAIDESQRMLGQLNDKSPYTAASRSLGLMTRGIGERMLGKLGAAITTLSQALELDPTLGEAYFRRGICLHLIGEDRMALADFQHAFYLMLITDPFSGRPYYDPRPRLWEGFLHAKLGDYRAAVKAYGDAIAESDRYTPAFVNRGLAYMMMGEYEKAIADLNDAIRIEPTNGDYFFKRGVAHEQLGELEKARDSFASAIHFDPQLAPAYRHMADVMQQLGHADLADQYRQQATQLEPGPSAQ